MRMRTKKWAKPELEVCPFYIKDSSIYKDRWNEFFKNPQPIWLELGCGKGGFIAKNAINNLSKNFIGVDLSSDMLGLTKRNIENAYNDSGICIDNIAITWRNIEQIDQIIGKDPIERIFINFCNPWYKVSQHKKRLTHKRQLTKYRDFLIDGGEIWFKTDHDDLFGDSISYFTDQNFSITYKTYDLHSSGFQPNIFTEHENMYSNDGIKIKFLIAKKL